MKHEGMDVYKNTATGDVIASAKEAKEAIKRKRLTLIGRGKKAYWVVQAAVVPVFPACLLRGLLVAVLGLAFIGCESHDPPAPVTQNAYRNTITDRQRLVAEFKTAEVYPVPGDEYQFVVRDTNGAVWFVKSDRNAGSAGGGKTMLFGPVVPVPVKVEDEETPEQRITRQTVQAAQAAAAALSSLTNR